MSLHDTAFGVNAQILGSDINFLCLTFQSITLKSLIIPKTSESTALKHLFDEVMEVVMVSSPSGLEVMDNLEIKKQGKLQFLRKEQLYRRKVLS